MREAAEKAARSLPTTSLCRPAALNENTGCLHVEQESDRPVQPPNTSAIPPNRRALAQRARRVREAAEKAARLSPATSLHRPTFGNSKSV